MSGGDKISEGNSVAAQRGLPGGGDLSDEKELAMARGRGEGLSCILSPVSTVTG